MNAESGARDVERRAAIHAALGDAGRLAIVDALSIGEASPGELGERLGMPSNLIAHHLRVLDGVGLVARHRSEGDRRRTYVALVRERLGDLCALGAPLTAQRVVFVCTQNSARSQLAVALWNDASTVPATSAGTDPASEVHPGAVAAARRRHLSLVQARPQHLDAVLAPSDLVVTVCDNAHEHLADHDGRSAVHWSIPDPVRDGDPAAFDGVVDDLSDRIARLSSSVRVPTTTHPEERSTS
ncbi:MAG: helix-turn-helix domain-containing protein [Pseudonocardia sp.]|uniref:arsenate reductase/protein-tyrosine-phosphatase family protein n=1 Tax=unclassified Pseudonocardia TaxID=2619320 RepID=UPI00086D22E6|nr:MULTISPECIES: helix-turn-helix domain-containing protein [unclassified Pseudonocardia]MBN9111572.1 helix-turn-helix domain-containing protein [Pseudonocardia sp.]ODU98213.1 MAG: ArsR family transcriptional regulator [Pseudonocardia sp. SCN 73-27]